MTLKFHFDDVLAKQVARGHKNHGIKVNLMKTNKAGKKNNFKK